jgi:Mg-chelatase subunit ChlD
MNESPFDVVNDEAIEARIVSWVLGDASAFEAAELERICEERPELLIFLHRIRTLHGLLTEAEAAEPDSSWKLPPDKRKVLDELFNQEIPVQQVVLKEIRIRQSGRRSLLAIAACFVLTGVLVGFLAPKFLSGIDEQTTMVKHASARKQVPASPAALDKASSVELDKAIRDQEDKVEERRKVLATIVRTKEIIYKGQDSFYGSSGESDSRLDDRVASVESREESIKRGLDAQDHVDAANDYQSDKDLLERMKSLKSKSATGNGDEALASKDESISNTSTAAPAAAASKMPAAGALASHRQGSAAADVRRKPRVRPSAGGGAGEGYGGGGGKRDSSSYGGKLGAEAPAAPTDSIASSRVAEKKNEIADPIDKDQQDSATELLGKNLAASTPLESMEEIAAADEPYSTFSLNINDASFQIAKAALEKGERPDPADIKVEQFYNAVDYGDPAPASNEAIAATIEQSAHPIIPGRNLVRVSLKTAAAGRSASQPLFLTLLVDQSGSMVREDRRAAMTSALAQLSGLLAEKDQINVIGFSRTPRLLADQLTGDQAAKLNGLINQTASEGGTNLEEALKLGEEIATRHAKSGGQNRVVLFTDGAANLGNANPERLAERVKSLRQKGVAFDIAGIGADGLNDRLLGELARHGNGRYYVVDGTNDRFARQLAGAFRPAAENVKVQVHFNPERVGHYKLIGFEKDRLKTEDFRNDAIDAAELAAEEAGVAVYQVESLPEGIGEIGEVSVRFRDASSGQMVERTWTISHQASAPPFDRATPSMQLAGLSMLAAEKLRGGPLSDAIDFKQLAEPQALVKQFYSSSIRVAEVLRMIEHLK